MCVSKNKKEKLILQTGPMSQSKVKSYLEHEENLNQHVVGKGKDILENQKR